MLQGEQGVWRVALSNIAQEQINLFCIDSYMENYFIFQTFLFANSLQDQIKLENRCSTVYVLLIALCVFPLS